MKLLPVLFPWLFFLSACQGYRILGVFPFFGKSHFMMFEHLMKGLARKGHQVDVISSFPLKKPYPNYTDIVVVEKSREFVNNFTYTEMRSILSSIPVYAVATLGGNELCDLLGHPEIQRIAKNPPKDPPYDAVVIEIFGAHCFAVLGHLLKVPIIGASSSATYPWSNDMIANPENLAFMPNIVLNFQNDMNFWQRTWNVLHTAFNKLYFNYLTRVQNDMIRKHFGDDMPGVRELEKMISLVLVNSHISMNGIRPMTPALVEVGGLHVQEEGVELPKSLEKWMNESRDGFIYFTFGSMVMIESFPLSYLEIFYKSLGKLAPVRVLMKVPNPNLLPPGLPKNILTLPWMPQIKVLKHPNIKAFITHGGLMGTQEAIYSGVPLIGIPLFADQFINIDTYVAKNFAVKLDLDTLTEETMDKALNAILHDPVYRETVRNISAKFVDRPLSPVDTATYWIEYVIKHGASSLRSPAIDLTWWQVGLLDVYGFLLVTTSSIVLFIFVTLNYLFNFIFPSTSSLNVTRQKKIS